MHWNEEMVLMMAKHLGVKKVLRKVQMSSSNWGVRSDLWMEFDVPQNLMPMTLP